MKITALIKSGAHQFYFVNKIHQALGIDLVIVEDKHNGKIPVVKQFQAKMALKSLFRENPRVPIRIKTKKAVDINQRIFKDSWYDIDDGPDIMFCRSINDKAVEEKIKEYETDILIDHGTSIVQNHIISSAKQAINLHWGLSPYYRGTHCTEWALINWDPRNIGVTIHSLSKEIDGGDVIGQSRVEIEEIDSVDSINMKLSKQGTEIMIEVLKYLNAGGELKFEKQDFSQGFLTLNRQWSRTLRQQIKDIEKQGLLKKIIKSPARKEEMPIVEFKG